MSRNLPATRVQKTRASSQPVNRLSTDELRAELARAITMTADALAYLAQCWVELERRGEDLSDLRISLAPYLRDVAQGRLAPEAVLTFAGQRMVLRWVAKQPIDAQRAIAAGAAIEVVAPDGTARQVAPRDLTTFDLRLAKGVAGTPASSAGSAASDARPERAGPKRKPITAQLTEDEYDAVVGQAQKDGLSISDLIRRALSLPLVGGSPR